MKTAAITIIQVYAPNTADSEEEVDDFYDQLQIAINQASKRYLLIVMGDFNAIVGCDWTNWGNVLHGQLWIWQPKR